MTITFPAAVVAAALALPVLAQPATRADPIEKDHARAAAVEKVATVQPQSKAEGAPAAPKRLAKAEGKQARKKAKKKQRKAPKAPKT